MASRRALRGLASQREFYHQHRLSTNTTKKNLLKTNVWTADTRHTRGFWMGHTNRHDLNSPESNCKHELSLRDLPGALRGLASQRDHHRTDYRLVRLKSICSKPMYGLPIRDTQEYFGWEITTAVITTTPRSNFASRN